MALTPLVKVAGRRSEWLANVAAYTLAGAVTSALVGAALGEAGALLDAGRLGPPAAAAAALSVAALVLARELGWLPVPLPQLPRQTRARWGVELPGPVVAALWGGDLGLTFSTYLTFSGPWLLLAVAVLAGSPALGAALFAAHWSGRAASVWVSPALLPDAGAAVTLVQRVGRHHGLLRRAHVAGVGLSIVVLASWLAQTPARAL